MSQIFECAAILADMRFTHRRVDQLPEKSRPTDLNTAYKIQDALVDHLIGARGGRRSGYKVACTNQLAQSQLNIPHPLYGQLISSTTFNSPATLKASDFSLRIVEVEFGIRIGKDVPVIKSAYEAKTVQPFIESVLPSIEIVSHRFHDWSKAGAASIAADNAIHGAWVHGKPVNEWYKLDLENHEAMLIVNGEIERIGQGSAVLGHPLNVVAWLANELPKHGKQLKRGEYITTGVICDVYSAKAGDELIADFGTLGSVELKFE